MAIQTEFALQSDYMCCLREVLDIGYLGRNVKKITLGVVGCQHSNGSKSKDLDVKVTICPH